MKKLLLIPFFLLLHVWSIAQNLVPNPSFEDTTGTGCPNGFFQSILPFGWYSYGKTPDYFNSCSPSNGFNSVPNNGWGYQYAATGNAYCGIWAYQSVHQNTREFIGGQLIYPTEIGQKYFINIKFSLAGSSNCGINKIGVLFSTISYNELNPAPVNNFAHVYSSNIITDTLNWINISGSFVADSAYQYIIIGNFFNDSNTDTIQLGPPKIFGYGAYYYVDDVYVGTDSLTTTANNNYVNYLTVYPNPTNGKIYFDVRNNESISCIIFNMLGQQMKISKNLEIDLADLPTGYYYLKIHLNDDFFIKKIALIK